MLRSDPTSEQLQILIDIRFTYFVLQQHTQVYQINALSTPKWQDYQTYVYKFAYEL